jgi:hypothetical protein
MAFSLQSERTMLWPGMGNSRMVGNLAGSTSFCSGFHQRSRPKA